MTLTRSHPAFKSNTSGNVGVLFAVMATAVAAMVGVGVDMQRSVSAEQDVQAALDATVLAAARDLQTSGASDAVLQRQANSFFAANIKGANTALRCAAPVLTIDRQAEAVQGVARCSLPTTTAGLVGVDKVNITQNASVGFKTATPTEFVLIMDTTRSMRSISKSWDDAVRVIGGSFEEILGGAATEGRTGDANDPYVRVSFLPMGDRVNIGKGRKSWLDRTPPKNWDGCVEPRYEPTAKFPYRINDASLSSSKGGKFAPSYDGNPDAFSGIRNITCTKTLVPATTDLAKLTKAVKELEDGGTGRFDIGLAWGWRLLSPKWQGKWGEAGYPRAHGKAKKVMAIFTDSHSTAWDYEAGRSDGKPRGHAWNEVSDEGFRHIEELCERIKDDGIELHVMLLNSYDRAEDPWKACATSKDTFYSIKDFDDFQTAFGTLSARVETIRLTS